MQFKRLKILRRKENDLNHLLKSDIENFALGLDISERHTLRKMYKVWKNRNLLLNIIDTITERIYSA